MLAGRLARLPALADLPCRPTAIMAAATATCRTAKPRVPHITDSRTAVWLLGQVGLGGPCRMASR